MPKSPNIRWTDAQKQKLAKAVNNYNAKITRAIERNPDFADFMPKLTTYDEVKSNIITSKDLNYLVGRYNRVNKEGALTPVQTEEGIKTTKWEVHEVALAIKKRNLEKEKERKRIDPSTERGTMGLIERNNLNKKVFNIADRKLKGWEKYKESAFKQGMPSYTAVRREQYKTNYLNTILLFADTNDILSGKAKQLYKLIESLDTETVVGAGYDDPILNIHFISDTNQRDNSIETSLEKWREYLNEKGITDYVDEEEPDERAEFWDEYEEE